MLTDDVDADTSYAVRLSHASRKDSAAEILCSHWWSKGLLKLFYEDYDGIDLPKDSLSHYSKDPIVVISQDMVGE